MIKWTKEKRITIGVILAICALSLLTWGGKRLYQASMADEIRAQFMQIQDPLFYPIDAKVDGSKTLIYQYGVKNNLTYETIQQNLEGFYAQILSATCLENRNEIHAGVHIIYQFYVDDPNSTTQDAEQTLFMEVPVSNETCRLIIY